MKYWFSADHHFGHANILEYANRPFSTVEEMDAALLENHNRLVKPEDNVYILGDFAWKHPVRYLRELNGRLHLILGNHDHRWKRSLFRAGGRVVWVKDTSMVKIKEEDLKAHIFLSHYPHRAWPSKGYGSWHLYGHVHGSFVNRPYGLSMDVGVDCWGYRPVDLQTIAKFIVLNKDRYS